MTASRPDRAAPPATEHGPTLDLEAADALLRRLEYTVRNKLDGLLQGNYQGLVPGPGSEAGEARQYVPGDDVRRMDWAVTARTTVPHIRQTIADRELETWLVVDLSASMDFGTALTEKRELVLAGITAVAHLTIRGGNRIGAIVGNGEQSYVVPARAGRTHARHLLRQIAQTPRAGQAGGSDLASMLEAVRRPQRRRGLIAVVSDFLESTTSAAAGQPQSGQPQSGQPQSGQPQSGAATVGAATVGAATVGGTAVVGATVARLVRPAPAAGDRGPRPARTGAAGRGACHFRRYRDWTST